MNAAALATLVALLAACATVQPPTPDGTAGEPGAAWARVLDRHVADDGRVDFIGIRENPRDLAAYVAWVATHGPRTTPALFPTRESRLAYHLNAYNELGPAGRPGRFATSPAGEDGDARNED
jgi:hypothetical protein